jgi:hypothetical protein
MIVGEYPELENAQRMIRFFYEQLKEANEQHNSYELQLQISNYPGELSFVISHVSDLQAETSALDVAAALEMNVGACLSLFSRLVDDDYLRISGGPGVLRGNLPTPVMSYIPIKGLAEIGELPNPNERLAAALEALARTAEADDRVPQTIGQRMRQAATDVNTLSTLGTNAGRLFASYFCAG